MDTISKLRIIGGYFENQVDLILRTDPKHRITTIYGSNGSGKSSIANAFQEIKDSNDSLEKEFSHVTFLNDHNNEVILSEVDKQNIWVYSEKYAEKYINWNEDNLGAIVMFGEQIEIDSEIKSLTEQYDQFKTTLSQIDTTKYEAQKGVYSISSALESIRSELRKDWAEREKRIKRTKTSPVTDNLINQIFSLDKISLNAFTKLDNEFESLLSKYLLIENNQDKLVPFHFNLISSEYQLHIRNQLNKKILKPDGSHLEEKILNLVLEGKRNLINDAFNHFSFHDNNDCPYCMQKVSEDHRQVLLKSIRSLFNDDVKVHIQELEMIKSQLNVIELDLDYLRKYQGDRVIELTRSIQIYNEIILNLITLVNQKIENPFDPINFNFSIERTIIEIKNHEIELLSFIRNFNDSIENVERTRNYLIELNKKIARYEIDDRYRNYLSLQDGLNKERKLHLKLIDNIEILKQQIDLLNSKKHRVDIALGEINLNLQQVFSGNNRLRLKLDSNSNYRVTSRGKGIKLKKLSTGERNVISLCYFFAHLRNNTDAFKKFGSPYFIVLDDPISSLDFDNKIGIYALLRKIFGEIISNNSKSRIIVLTHDLEAVFRLDKVFDDIQTSLNITNKNIYCNRRLLLNKNTEAVKVKNINSYGWNIEVIYEYANSNIDDENGNDFYIGNILRKTLEAYASFNFRKGFSNLTQSEEILERIDNIELREHYKNRMLRLLLNSESHTEEAVSAFPDHESFELFSKQERIQISRDVLCLLYLLDNLHIKSYLANDDLKIKNIEMWIEKCQLQASYE